MTDGQFIEECQFAKIVETDCGPAILIGGEVIRLYGAMNHGVDKRNYVDLVARALRREGELRPIAWEGNT